MRRLCSLPLLSLTTMRRLCILPLLSLTTMRRLCSLPLLSLTTMRRLCSLPLLSLTTMRRLCSLPLLSLTTMRRLCSLLLLLSLTTGGRFYFEVQVKDKTAWWLGVTRKSISRKYLIPSHTPENGIWILYFLKDKLGFFDNPDVRLPVRAELQKVGVFVDYDAGLVSFYDVEARAHIYSATGCTFSEPLYPILCPCLHDGGRNSTPLIISPVNPKD
ncbi:hypothetical protein NHX12_000654 [Muraenolepis orangiensis]|uniref:B30.2/SPRY domain-containing protein n=1 Tax=Muraenolepis orangiensis TaxID=630683 RepID=A0A9Q0I1H9_9TELE|nr:hypothetical protein NHX12_000654 [Muraenolepis orangiensis]